MSEILPLVAEYGPWMLALLAFLETVFVTGVFVPSGLATTFATALSAQGTMSLPAVAAAAALGGFAGDVTGYWIGRRGGEAMRDGQGMAARALARHDASTGRFLSGNLFYSVTLARLVAFVRTVMPLASGIARVPFLTFVLFEIPGLLAWVALYMAIGLLAGESWQAAGSLVGGGWLALFAIAGVIYAWRTRRRRLEVTTGATEAGS